MSNNTTGNGTGPTFTGDGGPTNFDRTSLEISQVPLFSLTIFFAIAYTILIYSRKVFRQNKLNWFTANICMTSAVFCIIMLTMTIQRLLGISSRLSCRIQGFLIHMSVCELMYSHCVAALCRLLAIVHANKRLFRSIGFALCCIFCGWLIALFAALPYFFVDGFSCDSESKSPLLSYYTVLTTLIIPIVLIGICNLRIFSFVRRSSRQVQETNGRARTSHARDLHLLKVLGGTFLVFVVGWAPVFLVQAFANTSAVPSVIDGITQVLPAVATFLDVILLILTNQPVRNFLKQLFFRRLGRTVRAVGHTVQPTIAPNTVKY